MCVVVVGVLVSRVVVVGVSAVSGAASWSGFTSVGAISSQCFDHVSRSWARCCSSSNVSVGGGVSTYTPREVESILHADHMLYQPFLAIVC